MTQHNTITGETLILGCFYFLRRGDLELNNNLLFKSKPAPIGTVHIWQDGKLHRKTLDGWIEVTEEDIPTGTFNGEIQILYDKRKFALIKQKLFKENLPTNRELAQMAGAHKNEKVTFIPTDKGIRIIIHHKDYVNDSTIFVDYKTHKPFISMGKVTKKEKSLKGLGFNILLNQILSCSIYGITHIEGKAERSMDMNGYYTWARYGFDGQIPLSNIVFKNLLQF